MQFDYEFQMVEPAEAWLRSKGLMVKREFPTPWGICDLVGCSFNKRNVKKRLGLNQRKPIGSHFRTMLLSRIPDEDCPIDFAHLAGEFSGFLDSERITSELNRLERDKFVAKTPSGSFYKLNDWMPIQRRLVALELKLSRVQDVLRQALSNLEFADESYIGLPMETASRLVSSKTLATFVEHGVGIVGLSERSYRVLRSAEQRGQRIDSMLQAHCVERFWRQFARGS